jgi:hypothetical protein
LFSTTTSVGTTLDQELAREVDARRRFDAVERLPQRRALKHSPQP